MAMSERAQQTMGAIVAELGECSSVVLSTAEDPEEFRFEISWTTQSGDRARVEEVVRAERVPQDHPDVPALVLGRLWYKVAEARAARGRS